MNVIFLFGPPAAGKFTVGQELSKLTGWPFFHNHLVFDISHTLFDVQKRPEEVWRLNSELRLFVLDRAQKLGLEGVIMSFVYGKKDADDETFVRDLKDVVESSGGTVYWVELSCPREELLKRVSNPERVKSHKISDPAQLERVLDKLEEHEGFPFEVLSVDSQIQSPEEAARTIAQELGLAF